MDKYDCFSFMLSPLNFPHQSIKSKKIVIKDLLDKFIIFSFIVVLIGAVYSLTLKGIYVTFAGLSALILFLIGLFYLFYNYDKYFKKIDKEKLFRIYKNFSVVLAIISTSFFSYLTLSGVQIHIQDINNGLILLASATIIISGFVNRKEFKETLSRVHMLAFVGIVFTLLSMINQNYDIALSIICMSLAIFTIYYAFAIAGFLYRQSD